MVVDVLMLNPKPMVIQTQTMMIHAWRTSVRAYSVKEMDAMLGQISVMPTLKSDTAALLCAVEMMIDALIVLENSETKEEVVHIGRDTAIGTKLKPVVQQHVP